MLPCVVWCGVMWCGAVRCGAVRCGVVCCNNCNVFNTLWCDGVQFQQRSGRHDQYQACHEFVSGHVCGGCYLQRLYPALTLPFRFVSHPADAFVQAQRWQAIHEPGKQERNEERS